MKHRLIHHIESIRSVTLRDCCGKILDTPEFFTHHGLREWGSPVEPQTLEALLLHQADLLSAQYGATKEVAL